jgi:hypothetical protein
MQDIKLNMSGHFNQSLADMGYIFPGTIQVDLSGNPVDIVSKLVTLLQLQGVSTDSVVTVALPGLSGLSMLLITAIHGLTGNFPFVTPLIRQQDGSFTAGETWDVTNLRNEVARTMRADLISL